MNVLNETSEKIMHVALKLFSEQGYYSTTTKQIAQEAGVNELTIFRHFKNKANLFQITTEYYVIEAHIDDILDDVRGVEFKEAMLLLSKKIYDYYVQNTKLYKVQLKLSDSETDFVKLKLSRKLSMVLKVYFEDLKAKGIIKGNPELMAVTLINSLLGAFTVDLLTDKTFSKINMNDIVIEHTLQFVALYENN